MSAEQTEVGSATGSKKASRMMPMLMVVGLMAAEGVGVFFLAKAMSPGPALVAAEASEGKEPENEAATQEDFAEVELAECRPSNKTSGKFITFHIRVTGLVEPGALEKVQRMVRARKSRIEHSVNTVIRSAEPKQLTEPELTTIQRRLKHEFDKIFGDDQLIKQVLIPQMLQSGPGV